MKINKLQKIYNSILQNNILENFQTSWMLHECKMTVLMVLIEGKRTKRTKKKLGRDLKKKANSTSL